MTKKTSQIPSKRLVLLDTHAIIHRAFHAVPNLVSSTGLPTGALFGLLNMLLKTIKDLKPDYIIACYDLPQPTFRHESYDAYKKGRKETEDILKVQIEESRNVFVALNIPMYDVAGFEADDMLGTIVKQVTDATDNVQIIIVSGDMDTLQLVKDDQVMVYTMKKGFNDTIMYNQAAVESRYNFPPKLVPDYKGLRGDPSDNIIGVPGIGEKTATDLITNFGTIENIYKQIHSDPSVLITAGIKQRIVDLLVTHEEGALFSKTLATIREDAPIEFQLPEQIFSEGYDSDKIVRLLRDYEFRSLVSKFENLFGVKPSKEFLEDDMDAPITAHAGSVDTSSTEPTGTYSLSHKRDVLRASIALWVLNSDMAHPSESEILQETETDTIADAFKILVKKLDEKGLLHVFTQIEEPLIPIIERMGEQGVLIDRKYLETMSTDYHKKLDILSEEIFQFTRNPFNINSPKQLSEILFNELGLKPKGKKNKTGNFSTRSDVLDELVGQHDIIQKIVEYRELQKLLSTYIDVLPTLLDEKNRLHAQFVQHGTTTGRFSSQNPNLQNIPIRTELGRAIRNAFIADPKHTLVSADYSQIELRVLAILSGDPILEDVFTNNRDIHATVASRVFHVAESEVTKNQRRDAKVINFGIIYGMGITALQKNLGTTRGEAETFYEAYFNEFPAIRNYLDNVKNTARETLMTKTLFGRVRNFLMFKSKLPYMQALAERTAVNAPIQGTAADLIKLAMIDVETMIHNKNWESKICSVLQIHDELVYEVPNELVSEFAVELKKTMESVLQTHDDLIDKSLAKTLAIPITVSVETGDNLGNLNDFTL
jgi:DNA polymerase-1